MTSHSSSAAYPTSDKYREEYKRIFKYDTKQKSKSKRSEKEKKEA